MELKPYQQDSLDTVDLCLEQLVLFRAKAEKTRALALENPDVEVPIPDFPRQAWNALRNKGVLPVSRRSHQYVSRKDGIGNDVPSVCLKIPTGGGKTLLGAYSVSRIMGSYLESNCGFVLWIVPNEAIYSQTKRQLTSREHPIRQILDLKPLVEQLSKAPTAEASYVVRVGIGTGKEWLEESGRQTVLESASFDTVYGTRLMVDVLPNPWVARALIGELLAALRGRGLSDADLGGASGYILEELRKWLVNERDRLAEAQFFSDVSAERIQFRLRADRAVWELPMALETDRPEKARKLVRPSSGGPVEKSIFAPVYEEDFNTDEADFACYLDEQAALNWWHRNVAKAGNYALQGWRKNRVYPDFVFAHQKSGKKQRIVVWETKGDQLEGNLDTVYKRKLLDAMSKSFKAEDVVHAGELELVGKDGASVICEMVLMSAWKGQIIGTLAV